jgi:hypothetical protein
MDYRVLYNTCGMRHTVNNMNDLLRSDSSVKCGEDMLFGDNRHFRIMERYTSFQIISLLFIL